MAERYTIEDVPNWMIDRGIGHIVAGMGFGSGWARWACGVETPYSDASIFKTAPSRICKKCRAVIDSARQNHLAEKERAHGGE